MVHRLIIAATLLAMPGSLAAAEDKPADNESAAALLVWQALESETTGKSSSRNDLLKRAANLDGENASARWHLGQVQWDGKWMRYSELPGVLNKQRVEGEYRTIRKTCPATFAGQLQLANWCRKNNLPIRERAHLIAAMQRSNNPNDPDLHKRLGQKLVGGKWIAADVADRLQAGVRKLRQDLNIWLPKIRQWALQRNSRRREIAKEAMQNLEAIQEPAALPALEAVFANAGLDDGRLLVRLLSRMKTWKASPVLARLAVLSPWKTVRKEAAQALQTKPVESFAPALLATLETPLDLHIALLIGSQSTQLLCYAENETQNTRRGHLRRSAGTVRIYGVHAGRLLLPGESRGRSAPNRPRFGPVYWKARRNFSVDLQLEAYSSERETALRNRAITEWNQHVCGVLATSTGVVLPADPKKWWEWWRDYNQVTDRPKEYQCTYGEGRKFVQTIPYDYRKSCLVAGTRIWTDRGSVAIENIRVGDLVLAKHPESGELSYQPVIHTTVRDPKPTLTVTTSKGEIRGTGGHVFWISGRGWVKLRDLKAGQRFHGATGPVEILKFEKSGKKEKTYNLVVDGFHSYFVGDEMILSHDVTFARPTDAVVPGLDPFVSTSSQ